MVKKEEVFNEELLNDNKKMFYEIDNLRKENNILEDEVSYYKNENDKLREVALKLLNSTSWKITKPIRASKSLLLRVKNKIKRVNSKVKVLMDNSDTKAIDNLDDNMPYQRLEIDKLVKMLSKYDIISFDMFDTLVFRYLTKPTDLFNLLELDLGISDFAKNRVLAEKEARLNTLKKNYEIDIYDIYERLNIKDKDKVILEEFNLELKVCYANEYLKEVVSRLQELGKKIIVVSDMYWTKKHLEKILETLGFREIEVFVSSGYEVNKGKGELQGIVNNKYPHKKVIHMGDNYNADILGSKKAGWETYYYKSCKDIAEDFNDYVSNKCLVSSVSCSLIYNYLYNGCHNYSKYYKYGFKYAGLLTCGFMEYLNKIVKEQGIDKIFFLARDAKVFYDVYNTYYKECDNDYVVISRSAMYEVLFESNMDNFINFYFKSRASIGKYTIASSLEESDLKFLVAKLSKYGLNGYEYLNIDNFPKLKEMIEDNYEEICKYFASSKESALKYFKKLTGNAKKILAVDLGWSGTIVSLLGDFYKENNLDCEVLGAFIANKDEVKVNNLVVSKKFYPYCFSYNNKALEIKVGSLEGSSKAMILESIFTSNDKTLLKYDKEFVYGPVTNNEYIILELHKGIKDFVKKYLEVKKVINKDFILDSYTVFEPLYEVLKNYKYNYNIFRSFKEYKDSLPRFNSEREITTIGKIMKDRNLV